MICEYTKYNNYNIIIYKRILKYDSECGEVACKRNTQLTGDQEAGECDQLQPVVHDDVFVHEPVN